MAQWLILQQDEPDDFVIATGEQHSVREYCDRAFAEVGIQLEWKGSGVSEIGVVAAVEPSPLLEKYSSFSRASMLKPGHAIICVDPSYFRPTEVETLLGDPAKAYEKLGWRTTISFDELIREMVANDLYESIREAICNRNGFPLQESCEIHM